jgi:tetratricopeptide (TPR) repeat protein
MRLFTLLALLITLLWRLLLPAVAAENAKNHIEFWQKNYEELRPQEDPRAARAHDIFKQVLRVAGSLPGVEPRLYITKTDPLNITLPIAIPDGWIVLSKGALEICYRNPVRGDDRLAFVLAHEIAHQLKDDFWHMKFFQAIEASKAQEPQHGQDLEEVRRIASKTDDVLAKELQADEYGIVYAAMAGFNTKAVVSDDDQVNFFAEWIAALDPQRATGQKPDPSHPQPQQRAATVKARLLWVLDKVELFAWGLRFYDAGMYQLAADAFAEFLRVFPSREVYHNLASSHHQLALLYYREWQSEALALPWKLSLTVDPVTRALNPRRSTSSSADEFQNNLGKAREFYQKAIALDPAYVPAYNNLGAALVLQEEVYKAIGVLQDALKLQPDAPETLNNLGVAFLAAENPGKGHAYLTRARELAAAYDAPLFNLGKLAHNAGQQDAARQYWMAYVQLDSTSRWAEAIRQTLALNAPTPIPGTPAVQENLFDVHIGAFRDELPAAWGQPVQTSALQSGKGRVQMVMYNNRLAVVLQGDEVRLMTTLEGFQGRSVRGVVLGSPEAEVRTHYGPPSRIVRLTQGTSWVYDASGIAFRLRDGRVASWLVFD